MGVSARGIDRDERESLAYSTAIARRADVERIDEDEWPPLACSVRGCARPLARAGSALVCAQGHAFDVARSGYCNLLQPNDRRSLEAGDSVEQVEARTRLRARGAQRELDVELARLVRAHGAERVLEVGCGPGFALEALILELGVSGIGLDLSAHAIDAAARRVPSATWIVANADRRLPILDRSVDVVVSITGPKHWPEFRRVLAPNGRAIVAVPAADDLIELRAAVLGAGTESERVTSTLAACAGVFELETRAQVRTRLPLDRVGLADLLLATYRGARRKEAERAGEIESLDVTLAVDVLVLAPLRE
jgi:23S rRNA (guanine745-N1)-methyltransferase